MNWLNLQLFFMTLAFLGCVFVVLRSRSLWLVSRSDTSGLRLVGETEGQVFFRSFRRVYFPDSSVGWNDLTDDHRSDFERFARRFRILDAPLD